MVYPHMVSQMLQYIAVLLRINEAPQYIGTLYSYPILQNSFLTIIEYLCNDKCETLFLCKFQNFQDPQKMTYSPRKFTDTFLNEIAKPFNVTFTGLKCML